MNRTRNVYRSIASMKTGLILLGLIGLASALGSAVLPDTFFNTILFKLMLLLLLVNMALCTINQSVRFKSWLAKSTTKRGWPRRSGILLLHGGIAAILVGGTVYAYYGQSGQISIIRNHAVDVSKVISIKKPVSMRLDDFIIDFNPDGSPSQYYSNVSMIEGDQTVSSASISVNHPLKYGEIKAYQQSFGYLARVLHNSESGNQVEDLLPEGDFLELPDTVRIVKIYRYLPDFDPANGMNQSSMQPNNPRIIYSVYENNKLLGIGAAAFGEKVEIDDHVYVTFAGVEPYTVLKVKSDPGLPLTLTGGLMFMMGVSLALLTKPKEAKFQQ